jgi:hypothetical protein
MFLAVDGADGLSRVASDFARIGQRLVARLRARFQRLMDSLSDHR